MLIWDKLYADPRFTQAILQWKISVDPRFCAKEFGHPLLLQGAVRAGARPLPFGAYLGMAMALSLMALRKQKEAQTGLSEDEKAAHARAEQEARWTGECGRRH